MEFSSDSFGRVPCTVMIKNTGDNPLRLLTFSVPLSTSFVLINESILKSDADARVWLDVYSGASQLHIDTSEPIG